MRHVGALTAEMEATLAEWIANPVSNRHGAQVGEVRAAEAFER